MMNSKSFVDIYDGGLQVEEIENEKKKNTKGTGGKNYQTGGMQQGNINRVADIHAVQQKRRFSNFN